MATSNEDGASASAYGGGGAGGKFRKKPSRRAHLPATPYDRPLNARISNHNNGSSNSPGLLAKLVVEPATKLISYGAHGLFAKVFRKRLPPPPPQAPEVKSDLNDELQMAATDCDGRNPGSGDTSHHLHSSAGDAISELEQLLKQKTFTRSEIDHLTGLLQSRAAVEISRIVGPSKGEVGAPDFERHQPFRNSSLEEHMKEGDDTSLVVMPSPKPDSRVIDDDIASPAELAKAYMGSRPFKVSQSNLGTRNEVQREDEGLLNILSFASKPPSTSLAMTTSPGLGNPKNGFLTPKSRGRSAIYNMARTPYSRVHPLAVQKGIDLAKNRSSGLSTLSSSPPLAVRDEAFESKSMTLKRRSSVLDDDPESVGPMRKIRQKPNLLGSGLPVIARGVKSGSDHVLASSKQELPFGVQQKKSVPKLVAEQDGNVQSASYSCVSSKSSEVAARILQHLDKLTPREKTSDSKLVTQREKSTFKLTPSMLRGQALRSMEDLDSSKLLQGVEDDKSEGNSVALSDDRDSTFQKPGKVEENGPKESAIVSDMSNPVPKNDFVEPTKAPYPSNGTADSAAENGVAERPGTKYAFRMSAQEDFLELDDDEHGYGLATSPSAEGGRPPEGNKLSFDEEPKLVETTIQPEQKLPVVSRETGDTGNPSSLMIGAGNGGISFSSLEKTSVAGQSDVLSQSIIPSDKPNGTNDPTPLLKLDSKAVDNALHLPSELISEKPESKSGNSISLVDAVSAVNGSKAEIRESDQGVNLSFLKAGDANWKSHTVPTALNGPPISRTPEVLFTTTSSHDPNQISTAVSSPFSSSTSIASFSSMGTSTSTMSSIGIASFGLTGFGSNTSSASNGNSFRSYAVEPVLHFGATVDPASASSAATTSSISEEANLKSKAEKEPSPGSSNGIHSAVASFVATTSGNSPLVSSTTISYSSGNYIQGSLPVDANKSLVPEVEPVSQSTSVQFGSSVSLPSFNVNSGTSLSTSLSHPQFNPNQSFGISSSASSSVTSIVNTGSGPTSIVGKFGMSSAIPGDSAVSLSASATPSIFNFGLSSSTSVGTSGSSNGVATPVVNYGGSSVAASVTNNASSSSTGTSGMFGFGASSSASTSATSNIFGSTWESPKPLVFSSTVTTSPPSTIFSFGALSSTFAPANAVSTVFNSTSGPSSGPIFSFSTASSPAFPSPSVSLKQPIFGSRSSFPASPGNGDQMNAEDSMAEDPVQSSAPSIPAFQQTISPSPPSFMFGSTAPTPSNPFQFGGQQNQIPPQNPSPFQASGSLEFNAGGSFSLGSGGADKSNRKFVKVNRNKNRKK